MSKKLLFLALPLLFFLSSWSGDKPVYTFTADEVSVSNQLIDMVNDYRLSIGLDALKRCKIADDLAAEHTYYMASQGQISNDHFENRLETLENKKDIEDISENMGYGNSAEETMEAYLNNVWLKVNVEGDYTCTGVAVKKDQNGKYYFTQIFYK
ncbi:MAG: CAP domain-containing protein [Flavobacteriaceae bacterium]|nr:CAP domain-containing protein [Flavobacteriaceae bacterium]MCB0474953.1 CAP domain-containing protein [Flavobacteriaceae bacterium]